MNKNVKCPICPKGCFLRPGRSGDCGIRKNVDGKLTLVTYGHPCSAHIDPIEKKPMFHFLPGSKAFSIATVGCNLHCKNCQNWEISQASPNEVSAYEMPPEKVVELAKKYECASIAYTYTDPVVFYEYAYDTSKKAHEAGIKNILVTAGYIKQTPLKELCKVVDGANIDLKAFSDEFYQNVCSATLKPVLDALVTTKNAGVTVEVTNLVIPTLNDSDKMIDDLCKWIKEDMGVDTPLHFSRFTPRYKMKNLPPTPVETLKKAKKIAKSHGLQYVYLGNILDPDAENTYCPVCGKLLVKRRIFTVEENYIKNGKCTECEKKAKENNQKTKEIYGTWN